KNWQKRLFDIILSSFSLIISIPIWLFIVFLIWWEDPGPVLFVKNAVGRKGVNFKQLKFRSMILNAEKETGPISGYENDERVLFFGRFLRKTALDELPQLINILRGDMSYVGPRPQRTVLVHGYLQRLPHYAARHRVRPGLAGLAQVADTYDISPQEKLAWDLVYIEHANLWFDIKLAMAAFLLVFVLRWRSQEEPEKVIRKMLNVYKPALQTNIKPD
ncbi:MAG: sugar transferase, partial [Anaerolineales bacterium]